MFKKPVVIKIGEIEFKVVYSGRRTLGISVLPDSSVIVRVPDRTPDSTITRIVKEKASWIIKHRDNYKFQKNFRPDRRYHDGEAHMFRGYEAVLKIARATGTSICFNNGTIEMGMKNPDDTRAVKALLYKGYKEEAMKHFPLIFNNILEQHKNQSFKPTGLIIRTMKRRWGSCSNKGIITLSTELIKLPDLYLEYVIVHELCHLKHHNHGNGYYKLLSDLFPGWKQVRKEMKTFIN